MERTSVENIEEMFKEDEFSCDRDSYFSGYRTCESIAMFRHNKLEQQLKLAHEVIEFYASDKIWDRRGHYGYDLECITRDDLSPIKYKYNSFNVGGKRARQYLDKYKKE